MHDQPSADRTPKHLFISDVHLGASPGERDDRTEQALVALVDYAEAQGYQIHILGDLFDYWMEYPDSVPDLGRDLLERFRAYNERRGSTLYITGNHDCWTGGYFEEAGFDMEDGYRVRNIGGSRVLMLHGDGVRDESLNLPRPRLHRLLRSDGFVRLFRKLFPPETGWRMMRWFSAMNRRLEQRRSTTRKLNRWAEKTLKENDIDVILCGHDHTPRKLSFRYGTYLNLGTFNEHRTLVAYNNGQFELVVWNEEEKTLGNYETTRNIL